MHRTISAPAAAATSAACRGVVPGLNAIPTAETVLRARVRDARGIVRRLDVERDRVGAGCGELLEMMRRVVDHQVAVEHAAARRGSAGAIDRSTTGPIVTGGTKWPSPTVEMEHAAARREQLVDLLAQAAEVGRVERRLHLEVVTDPVAPGHGSIATGRTRQRIAGGRRRSPLVPCTCGSVCRNSGRVGCRNGGHSSPSAASTREARTRSTTASLSSALTVHDRVDDRAARPDAGRPPRAGARAGAPAAARRASAGPAATRARRDPSTARRRARGRSRSAQAADRGRRRGRRGRSSPRADARSPRARARGASFDLDRDDVASEHRRLPARGRAEVEHRARPAARRRRARRAASRGSAARCAPLRAPPRRRGRLATRRGSSGPARPSIVAADEPDGGLRRLVLRTHQRRALVRRRGRATTSPRSSPDTSAGAPPPAACRRAATRHSSRLPSASRRRTAFANGTARSSRARRTSSTDSFTAAYRGTPSRKPSWYAPSRSAARTGRVELRARGACRASRSRGRASARAGPRRTRAAGRARGRGRRACGRGPQRAVGVRVVLEHPPKHGECDPPRTARSRSPQPATPRVDGHPPPSVGLHLERLEAPVVARPGRATP